MRINYCLARHPSFPIERETRREPRSRFGTTLRLSCFVEEWDDDWVGMCSCIRWKAEAMLFLSPRSYSSFP